MVLVAMVMMMTSSVLLTARLDLAQRWLLLLLVVVMLIMRLLLAVLGDCYGGCVIGLHKRLLLVMIIRRHVGRATPVRGWRSSSSAQ